MFLGLLNESGVGGGWGGTEMRSVPEIKDKALQCFNWVCSSGFIQYKEIYARGVGTDGRRPRVEWG